MSRSEPLSSQSPALPSAAVVVATRNRARDLAAMLDSLDAALPHAPHTEIWLVDNGSTDDTPNILRSWAARHRLARVLTVPTAGKSRALNAALEHVRADVVLFTDDDVVVDARWIVATLQFFARHSEVAATAGRILPLVPTESSSSFSSRDLSLWRLVLPLYDYGEIPHERQDMYGANMAVRTAALGQIGGFDVTLGVGALGFHEDVEFARRLRQAGYRVFYNPEAIVYHQIPQERLNRAYVWHRGLALGYSGQLAGLGCSPSRHCAAAIEAAFAWLWATTVRRREKQLRSEFRLARHWGALRAQVTTLVQRG